MCKHATDLIFIIENTSLTQFACVLYTVDVCVLGVVELGIVLQMVKVNYADSCGCVCLYSMWSGSTLLPWTQPYVTPS